MHPKLVRARRLSAGFAFNALHLAASCIPRDGGLWIFGAWNGRHYGDNARYLYEFARDHQADAVTVVWITKDLSLARELSSRGVAAHYYLSLRGLWFQLRAGVVVVSHSVDWDLWAPVIARRTIRVQTWHGSPVKKIGYDDDRGISAGRARTIARLFPYRSDHFDLVLAAGPADRSRFRSAFNVTDENVVISGYPRNDRLSKPQSLLEHLDRGLLRAIYMPTLRGPAGSIFPLFSQSGLDLEWLDRQLRLAGIELYVRIHPAQRLDAADLDAIGSCTHILVVSDPGLADVHDYLGGFDVLITDFSSIFLDFLITQKPIIMAPFNLDDYRRNDRGLYYPYEEVCPSPPRTSWEQVLGDLTVISSGRYSIGDGYLKLLDAFQTFRDSGSAERAYLAVLAATTDEEIEPRRRPPLVNPTHRT